jgi:hypothetical protein
MYTGIYFLSCFFFESRNPAEKTDRRKKNSKKEMYLSVLALIPNVGYVMFWNWLIDPNTKYFGYYETHSFTLWNFIMNFVTYFLVMDTWFLIPFY